MDRVNTGIEGLDQLLHGGFLRGDAILAAGAPGTGKTSLGMQYLYNGITKYREPGLFITFEEFPERIYRDASNYGWDFRALEDQGKLKVLFTSPEVLQQDIIRDQGIVREMIAEIGATRVVVDSISNLEGTAESPRQFRESVYGLVNALKSESLTSLLIREVREDEDAIALGIICRKIMRRLSTPRALAAATKSCSRKERNSARTKRVAPIQLVNPMTIMIL